MSYRSVTLAIVLNNRKHRSEELMVIFILRLIGSFLAASLDIIVGMFIVFFVSLFSSDSVTNSVTIQAYIIGGLIALSPDFDVLWLYVRGNINYDHHKLWTHRPFIMLPTAFVLGWLLGGMFWAAVAPLCLFWHYLHDTEGFPGGGGIMWFWPFSKKFVAITGEMIEPDKSPIVTAAGPHHEWLDKTWLCFRDENRTAIKEIAIGMILLWVILFQNITPTFSFVTIAAIVIIIEAFRRISIQTLYKQKTQIPHEKS